MPEPTIQDWNYAAGLFDGEGHIAVAHTPNRWSGHYQFYVAVMMMEPEPLIWLHETFGGSFKPYSRTIKGKPRIEWRWGLCSDGCTWFLEGIRPFLKTRKAGETDIALEYRKTFVTLAGRGRGRTLSPDVVAFRDGCIEKIRLIRSTA